MVVTVTVTVTIIQHRASADPAGPGDDIGETSRLSESTTHENIQCIESPHSRHVLLKQTLTVRDPATVTRDCDRYRGCGIGCSFSFGRRC